MEDKAWCWHRTQRLPEGTVNDQSWTLDVMIDGDEEEREEAEDRCERCPRKPGPEI